MALVGYNYYESAQPEILGGLIGGVHGGACCWGQWISRCGVGIYGWSGHGARDYRWTWCQYLWVGQVPRSMGGPGAGVHGWVGPVPVSAGR